MGDYYSTAATVLVKANALKIVSGVIDYDQFDGAAEGVQAKILAYVEPRYGSTITDDWDSDTRPALIGEISDWMTLYNLLTGNNAEHPVAIRRYDESVETLRQIQAYELMIPGIDFESGQTHETTRMAYLECTESDANNGLCDPCAYEYI